MTHIIIMRRKWWPSGTFFYVNQFIYWFNNCRKNWSLFSSGKNRSTFVCGANMCDYCSLPLTPSWRQSKANWDIRLHHSQTWWWRGGENSTISSRRSNPRKREDIELSISLFIQEEEDATSTTIRFFAILSVKETTTRELTGEEESIYISLWCIGAPTTWLLCDGKIDEYQITTFPICVWKQRAFLYVGKT